MAQLSRFSSRYPPVKIPRDSYYTFIHGQDTFSSDQPFTINGQNGHVVTRGHLWADSRRLAYGLRNARKVGLDPLEKGSVAMILSPASDLYMVVQMAMVSFVQFRQLYSMDLTRFCQAAAGIACAPANPALSPKELAHAINVSQSSHILAHFSIMPLVSATLSSMGHSKDAIRRRVIIISSSDETPVEYKTGGWVTLDRLDFTPVPSVPERFDGDDADATAIIYFSSGV